MANDDDLGDDAGDMTTDVFDPDTLDEQDQEPKDLGPLYKVYAGSRIPVSRSVGVAWKQRFDATRATRELLDRQWDEAYKYYNNTQVEGVETPRGVFHRGDSTENVVYSNINIMLPAVYGQDPDITINTTNESTDDFVACLKTLLNALIRRKQYVNAKPKMRKAAGIALLTNCGVVKLDYTLKDDSRQAAFMELQTLSDELAKAKNPTEVEAIYGKIEALESTMEVRENSGPKMNTVMSHNLWIDPYAELPDATDGNFMIEKVFIATSFLNAKYTEKGPDGSTVLSYKPTHKATFTSETGTREDGIGMVMDAISGEDVVNHEDQKRAGYRGLYYTECYYVWDKLMRRVFLFQRDDWTWPVWVWDDYLKLSRFFPYYIITFGMATGGSQSVGEVSYYLDQQDEINEINRKVARIRRSIFDYFFYDSNGAADDQIANLLKAVRGDSVAGVEQVLGVKVPEGKKLSDMIMHLPGPDQSVEPFFKKEPILETINRVSNTSDALRGVQFKTNTNEAAVQSYQDSARLSVGAKQDIIEDTMSAVSQGLAELCVQFMTPDEVAGIIGVFQAINWQNMDVQTFNSQYSMEVVAGSTEKPNSAFKKKEAVQIGQMLGQFSSAAPLTALKIMLKVLQNAFTEVNITPEDWKQLEREAEASMQQGISTGGGGAPPAPGDQGQPPAGNLEQAAMQLPPQAKQQIMQMKNQGVPPEQIKQKLLEMVQANGQSAPPGTPQPHQIPQKVPQMAQQ